LTKEELGRFTKEVAFRKQQEKEAEEEAIARALKKK
jgi:hypothetical protein